MPVCPGFSKAFDTVRHSELLQRIQALGLPDYIYNWVNSFLTGRSHSTKWGGTVSSCLPFNAGVVQGSAVGPASFVVCASGLQLVNPMNRLFKYADDTYLLVPASQSGTVMDELNHIDAWSRSFNLKPNISKCKELVIQSPTCHSTVIVPPTGFCAGVQRVKSLVILGIHFNDKLSVCDHISDLICASNRIMFALRTLKRAGLPNDALWVICRATLVAKLLYCSSAWWGFANKTHINSLEGIMRRAVRWGLFPVDGATLNDLALAADRVLFRKVLENKNHILHSLLPPVKVTLYNLRPRVHDRVLPLKTSLSVKNFLTRMLYDDV